MIFDILARLGTSWHPQRWPLRARVLLMAWFPLAFPLWALFTVLSILAGAVSILAMTLGMLAMSIGTARNLFDERWSKRLPDMGFVPPDRMPAGDKRAVG